MSKNLMDPTALVKILESAAPPGPIHNAGVLPCPTCNADRRVDILRVGLRDHSQWRTQIERYYRQVSASMVSGGSPTSNAFEPIKPTPESADLWPPFITGARARCLQCDTSWLLLLMSSTIDGPTTVSAIGTEHKSIATPSTPPTVRPYLVELARCQSAGAHMASVALLRASVEAILHDQGFTNQMLGPKLGELQAAMASGTAPAWANSVDHDVLALLKKLGNWALHADGSATKDGHFDEHLASAGVLTLAVLLDQVYEEPARREAMKAKLAQAAALANPTKGHS